MLSTQKLKLQLKLERMMNMKMLSLFSGIGGIDIAAEWAGITPVAFCEIEKFPQMILTKHWPHIPIFNDITKLNKGVLQNEGINNIDIICGGFPCQPWSQANPNRQGENDDRHLFPAMLRLVKELQPRWVVGENVAGFTNLPGGLDAYVEHMENISYTTEAIILTASSVGAPHKRERVFLVSYPFGFKWNSSITPSGETDEIDTRTWNGRPILEPGIPRVVNGVPHRLDRLTKGRLRALGNAVVPQEIFPILRCIKSIDDSILQQKAA